MQDMEDERKIKNKPKKEFIKFFYELFELVNSNSDDYEAKESDDDGEEED